MRGKKNSPDMKDTYKRENADLGRDSGGHGKKGTDQADQGEKAQKTEKRKVGVREC